MAIEVAKLQATLGLAKEGFDKGIKSASSTLGKFAGGVGGIALNVGTDAVTMAGRAVGDFAAGGVKDAMALEQQLANTAAVMGESIDAIAPLNDLIIDLSLNPNLKVSAFEAADAIELLARNGLKMDEIMSGAAESTVVLANATGADFGMAADIATDTMSLFGIEADNMGRAVDGITSVVTNSKFSIDDYRLALAQGGGVASSVGVEFEDFNTSIAAIAPLFASGSDAGTSFKTLLQSLPGKSGPALEALSELGLMAGDLPAFFDLETGDLKSMADIAGLLNESIQDMTEVEIADHFSTAFGTDAMRAAFGLAKVGKEGFLELQQSMGGVDAGESVETRMDTISGKMEIFQGQIEALGIQFGQAMLEPLGKIIEKSQEFIDMYGDTFITQLSNLALGFVEFSTIAGEALNSIMNTEGEGGLATELNSLKTTWETALADLAESDALNRISEAFGRITDVLGIEPGDIALDWLKEEFGKLETGIELGVKAIDALALGMERIAEAVEKADEFWGKFKEGLGTLEMPSAIQTMIDKFNDLAGAIPAWLIPGSPPPLYFAFEDINRALNQAPDISAQYGFAQAAGRALPVPGLVNGAMPTSGGGEVVEVHNHIYLDGNLIETQVSKRQGKRQSDVEAMGGPAKL